MLKYCLLIFCCVLIILSACKKDSNIPVPGLYTPVLPLSVKGAGVSTPLTGSWQWIKSYHTTTGIANPATSNYVERLVFGTDSIMTIYRNDKYYYRFTYLYISQYKYSGRVMPVTQINGYNYETVIRNDTLNFSTFDLSDQNELTYVRIKP